MGLMPQCARRACIQSGAGYDLIFGGTGMLITVGVILDTMRQIETFLLQRHYDGFLKKGRIRGRSTSASVAIGEAASDTVQVYRRPLAVVDITNIVGSINTTNGVETIAGTNPMFTSG